MNDNLTKEFCRLYRGRVNETSGRIYSSPNPSTNFLDVTFQHNVEIERLINIQLPETDYQRLCKQACEQEVEREIRYRHSQVYVAWHQYQMMLQLYK